MPKGGQNCLGQSRMDGLANGATLFDSLDEAFIPKVMGPISVSHIVINQVADVHSPPWTSSAEYAGTGIAYIPNCNLSV
jgi:hypothetical protein